MSCNEFEDRMADALAGDSSAADRDALDRHLAQCASCRREFESLSRTQSVLQSLPSPRRVEVTREGDRLVIGAPSTRLARQNLHGAFRLAASVLIAFTAGYGLHAAFTLSGAGATTNQPATVGRPGAATERTESLESSLVAAYRDNPMRSDLAKGLIAMAARR